MRTMLLALAVAMPCVAGAQSVTRKTSFEYDSFGQLTKEITEPEGAVGVTRLTMIYSRDPAFGVVTLKQLAFRDPQTGGDVLRDVETSSYDSRRRFPLVVTNASQLSETRIFDEMTGNALSLTDSNQLTTTWSYDGWGRRTMERRPDGSSTTWAYRQCVEGCLNQATSVLVEQHWFGTRQVKVPSETLSDALGRKVATLSWGYDGRPIQTQRVFDAAGRLDHVAQPYFQSDTPIWIWLSHDDLGRVTEVRAPNATGQAETSLLQYDGPVQTHINVKGQRRLEVTNGLGKLKRVTDDLGFTTSFAYDGYGGLVRTTDPKGNQIQVFYDNLGRKTRMVDPDLGTWDYLVNPLGQTYSQTDAKGQTTIFSFDAVGRMVRRLAPDQDSRWDYDSAVMGKGQLAEAYTWAGGAKDFRRVYAYDAMGRIARVTFGLDWDYVQESLYDAVGRPYAGRFWHTARGGGAASGPTTISTVYNAQGYPAGVQVDSGGVTTMARTALQVDALGRVTQEQLGNGLIRRKSYNSWTGRLIGIQTGVNASDASIQNDAYVYDSLGNLTGRSQLVTTGGGTWSESFDYDSLNRLTSSQVAGQLFKSHTYDSLGNLRTKDDATTRYSYPVSGAGSVRPHALGAIESPRLVAGKSNPAFNYDSNGNLEEGLDRRYGWTSFNQAATIDRLQGGVAIQRTAFNFDTEQQRVRQSVHAMNGGSPQAAGRVIHYAGSIEKEVDVAANVTTIRIPLGEGLGYLEERFASTTVDAAASGPRSLRYLLGDHLGSAVAVLDQNRVVLQRMSYDPWGRRRNTDGSDDVDTSLGTLSNLQNHAGYTGQEQLDHLALVHLNGRIYDPITSRMISADPTVPDPSDTQHLNRYTYVSNNALTFVDPSGFSGLTAMGRGDWQVVYNSKADGPAFDRSGGTNGMKLTTASTSSPTEKPLSDAEMMEKAKQLEIERKAREAAAQSVTAGDVASNLWNSGDNWIGMTRNLVTAAGTTTWNFLNLLGAGVSGDSQWAADSVDALLNKDGGATVATAMLVAGKLSAPPVLAEAGSIRNVNVVGGKMNCVNCVVATDATLAGRPASALGGGPFRINVLERVFGGRFGPPGSIEKAAEALSAAGPGARGIVFGSRGSGEVGHVFNAVNQKGVVRFLDGQTGQAASLEGYKSFQLLRTN